MSRDDPTAAGDSAFYDSVYENFGRQLAATIRAEAFEEDIGQNSWLTATEHRKFCEMVELNAKSEVLETASGSGGPALFMVEHSASGDQVESSSLDRAGEDVPLTELHVRGTGINQRQVEIQRHYLPAGRGSLAKPYGDRTVSTPNVKRSCSRPHAERFDVPAVHRIEQPRHQRQPLPLATLVMIEDVIRHAVPPLAREATVVS